MGNTCAAQYFCGEYARNLLSFPTPETAPHKSSPSGHKICISAPCSHKHSTIKNRTHFILFEMALSPLRHFTVLKRDIHKGAWHERTNPNDNMTPFR